MAGCSLGEIQEAIMRLRALDPELSIAKIMQRIAHFRQVDLEFYAKALRLAGLPE